MTQSKKGKNVEKKKKKKENVKEEEIDNEFCKDTKIWRPKLT